MPPQTHDRRRETRYDPVRIALAREQWLMPEAGAALDGLTDRQTECVLFIAWFLSHNGFPPSVRELMAAMGCKSPNGVVCHLQALQRKGWIRFGDSARGIRLLRPVPAPEVELRNGVLRVGCMQWELTGEQVSHLAGFR